jgi:hypothetical protein
LARRLRAKNPARTSIRPGSFGLSRWETARFRNKRTKSSPRRLRNFGPFTPSSSWWEVSLDDRFLPGGNKLQNRRISGEIWDLTNSNHFHPKKKSRSPEFGYQTSFLPRKGGSIPICLFESESLERAGIIISQAAWLRPAVVRINFERNPPEVIRKALP